MDNSKVESSSKPILSPTRSLDEGFESDPDRISTDSEQSQSQTVVTVSEQPPLSSSINGIQPRSHISRRNYIAKLTKNPPLNEKNENVSIPRASAGTAPAQPNQRQPFFLKNRQVYGANKNSAYYRRNKNKINVSRSRSGSGCSEQDFQMLNSLPSTLSALSIVTTPSSATLQSPTTPSPTLSSSSISSSASGTGSIVPQTVNNNRLLTSTNSLYTFYPAEGNIQVWKSENGGLTYTSSRNQQQFKAPVCWTQSIPRQTRR